MGEQPDPVINDSPVIQALVIEDMHARWVLGKERYRNDGLQVGNGRRMSQDFLEEVQDMLVYATGVREQDRQLGEIVIHLLDIHRRAPGNGGMCQTCIQPFPCHTAVDLEHILEILGITRENTGE